MNTDMLFRAAELPESLIPEIEEKLKPLNIKWSDFKVTNNTCGPHPPAKSAFQRVRKLRNCNLLCLCLCVCSLHIRGLEFLDNVAAEHERVRIIIMLSMKG